MARCKDPCTLLFTQWQGSGKGAWLWHVPSPWSSAISTIRMYLRRTKDHITTAVHMLLAEHTSIYKHSDPMHAHHWYALCVGHQVEGRRKGAHLPTTTSVSVQKMRLARPCSTAHPWRPLRQLGAARSIPGVVHDETIAGRSGCWFCTLSQGVG